MKRTCSTSEIPDFSSAEAQSVLTSSKIPIQSSWLQKYHHISMFTYSWNLSSTVRANNHDSKGGKDILGGIKGFDIEQQQGDTEKSILPVKAECFISHLGHIWPSHINSLIIPAVLRNFYYRHSSSGIG